MAIYNREDFMTALPQIEAEIASFRKQMAKELKELDDKIEQFSSGVADVKVNGTSVVTDSVAVITVPTKVSQLTNDSGFITGFTETDPTVPSWAKASSKPSYTAGEVGALASADLYTRSSSGGLDWGTGSTGNMVIAKSALAFWNGSYDGTTSNLQRLNGTVYVGGTQMKDFIKEQGTSSSWYYRKWNSGKVEAWRTYNAGSLTPTQWIAGAWYVKDFDVAIPSGIFSAAPNHTVATNNGSDYQYMVHVARATSATNIRVRVCKPNSGAATPVIALYVSNMV